VPSTFTTNTGIEKPADGEQTGLWGQTTNLNFDIVDRALNGSGAVTLSGTTHTLTTSSGVLSDGQFAVLVFTGSPSGTNTVTIAPNTAQKLYWVRNTTSEDVALTQGSGGDVTVPAGATKAVYVDGAGAGAAVVDLTAVFVGDVTGNVTGNLTGNADTATALQTARTIGGVSFDGTANIDLPGVNQAGNQNTSGNAATATLATSATALATARTFTIGATGRTFDGSADVSWNLTDIGAVAPIRSITAGAGLTGGGDLSSDRTIDADIATAAQIQAFGGTDKLVATDKLLAAAALISPSGAANWTPDWTTFISANWVLTGNRTLENPTNVIAGTTRVFRAASDGATGRTISFGSNYIGDLNGGPVTNTAPLLYMLFARTTTEIWVSVLEAS
jgi:hypothetical protein